MPTQIKKLTLTELLLIIVSFYKSFWLGILILGYILDTKKEKTKMPTFKDIPDNVSLYKTYVIKKYNQHFIIVKPNGEKLKKVFKSLSEAKKEIDIIY